MRKSILLFFLLLAAIVLMKVNETLEEQRLQNTAVEELVSDTNKDKIAKN